MIVGFRPELVKSERLKKAEHWISVFRTCLEVERPAGKRHKKLLGLIHFWEGEVKASLRRQRV